jgi:hypothetical protein
MGRYTVNQLFDKAEACENRTSDSVCTVEYDPDYGYPKAITQKAAPNVVDGNSQLQVLDFHVIESAPKS